MRNKSTHLSKSWQLLRESHTKMDEHKQKLDQLKKQAIALGLYPKDNKQTNYTYRAEIKSLEVNGHLLTIWNKDSEIVHQSREKLTSEAAEKIIALSKDVEVTISNKFFSYVIVGEKLETYIQSSKKEETDPVMTEWRTKSEAYKADYQKYKALQALYFLHLLGKHK